MTVADEVLETVISEYTREAGVRQLERELGKVLRKTATRIASEQRGGARRRSTSMPCATRSAASGSSARRRSGRPCPASRPGLAVTGVGGDVLFVEATSVPGGEKLVLTGQLGDVMKESAQIALSAVRARAGDYGLDDELFENRSFHVHVPAGAIPKDGPSAGITMATALASLLTGRPVRAHGRDDRRGDPAGPRAADRRSQAEGARRARGRADRRRHPRAQPRRSRRRARSTCATR